MNKKRRRVKNGGQHSHTINITFKVPHQKNLYFTGREDVLRELHRALDGSREDFIIKAIAITGLGGIGKTQTALEYAHRYRSEYTTVLWIRADTQDNLFDDYIEFYIEFLSKFNLPEGLENDPQGARKAVNEHLKNISNWLLIYDNVNDSKLLDESMPVCGNGNILITTQIESLDISGLQTTIRLGVFSDSESEDFLIKKTKRTGLNARESESLKELVKELGGLPLALAQAAAYLSRNKALTLTEYIKLYHKIGIPLLEEKKLDEKYYPYSVQTTWELSIEKLEHESQTAADILLISGFLNAEKIPIELFAEEFRELSFSEQLSILMNYSLINIDIESKAFDIHRLVQAVIRSRTKPEIRKKKVIICLRLIEALFQRLNNEKRSWREKLPVLSHGLKALEHAQDEFKGDIPLNCMYNIKLFEGISNDIVEKFSEAIGVCNYLRDRIEKELSPGNYTTAINNLVSSLDAKKNSTSQEKNLPPTDQQINIWRYATVTINLATYLDHRDGPGDLDNALAKLNSLIEPDQAEKILNGRYWWARYQKGIILLRLKRYAEAESELQEVRDQSTGGVDRTGALHQLAIIDIEQKRYSEAETKLETCLTERSENEHRLAYDHHRLAQVYARTGRQKQAKDAFKKAKEISRNSGHSRYLSEIEQTELSELLPPHHFYLPGQ